MLPQRDLWDEDTDKWVLKASGVEQTVSTLYANDTAVNLPSLERDLGHKTMLFLGSSLDKNTLVDACARVGANLTSVCRSHLKEGVYDSCTRNNWMLWCSPIGGFSMAFLLNFGYGEPPYYTKIEANFWHDRSEEHIMIDGHEVSVRGLGTSEPSVVVVDSSLWDLSRWWEQKGKPESSDVPDDKLLEWCHEGVPQIINWTARAFPKSAIAFRTPPTMVYAEFGRTPEAIEKMADCIRKELIGKVDLIDYHALVDSLGDRISGLYTNAAHPSRLINLMYWNTVLNYVRDCSVDCSFKPCRC